MAFSVPYLLATSQRRVVWAHVVSMKAICYPKGNEAYSTIVFIDATDSQLRVMKSMFGPDSEFR